jgi:putative transposase
MESVPSLNRAIYLRTGLSKTGISQATYYNWRKKYGGLMPSEMKRLKQLEEENLRLRKLVADLSLDKEMLQDVLKRKP